MARNDGIDRTVARNKDLPTPDDVAKIQEHNEREKDSYSNQDIVPERHPYLRRTAASSLFPGSESQEYCLLPVVVPVAPVVARQPQPSAFAASLANSKNFSQNSHAVGRIPALSIRWHCILV